MKKLFLTLTLGILLSACSANINKNICGDKILNNGVEECDGNEFEGKSCLDYGFDAGHLKCTDSCNIDSSDCFKHCGEGIVQEEYGEECDGFNLNYKTCEDVGYYGGYLRCSSDCSFDTSECVGTCGDGILNGDEKCDGLIIIEEETCETNGMLGGELYCNNDCTLNVSNCEGICGDGIKTLGEECDGDDIGDAECGDGSIEVTCNSEFRNL